MVFENDNYVRCETELGEAAFKCSNNLAYESSELFLVEYGMDACTPNFDWGPGYKDIHVIHYVISGRGIVMCNDRYYEVSAGQAFYVSPEDLCYYRADSTDPWRYLWLRFDGTKANLCISATKFPAVCVVQDYEDNFLLHSITQIGQGVMDEKNTNFYITGLLYCFLGELIRRYPRAESVGSSVKLSYVNAAVDYIKANYMHKGAIGALAKFLNLTPSYLNRIFKEQMGCSPVAYMEQYRIDRACSLLSSGVLAMHEIATVVGYGEYSAFYKSFKKKMGISPQEYQQAYEIKPET